MNRFVLDCSMTMAWCFEDEAGSRADAALANMAVAEALVPSIWPLEVANVLAVCERRGRITTASTTKFLGMLGNLPISVDDQTAKHAFGEVLLLARAHNLSAYDVAYLELALRTGSSLATLDAALEEAATALGIEALGE